MKLDPFNRVTLSATFLTASLFAPNLRADNWSSLHGNNRSAAHAPAQAAVPRPQPQQHANQPVVHAPEPRPEVQPQPAREQPREVARGPEHSMPVVDRNREHQEELNRARVAEADHRRMDIDEDRRASFFWSDFHAGMRIDRLPDGWRRIGVRGHPFFYFEGVYYDQAPSGYVIVAPPVDAIISDLPPGTQSVVVGDTLYYYAGGAFYVQLPDGTYVVVAAPIGVTVTMLPPDVVSVVVNGIVYYQADGTYYLPVMQNGVTVYLTVQQP